MLSIFPILLLLIVALPAAALAQAGPERGGFIVRMGSDTLAVERFTRTATQLEGEVVSRVPAARAVRYTAALNPDATISRIEISGEPAEPSPGGLRTAAEVRFVADSAHTVATRGDSTQHFAVPMSAGAMPFVPFTYAIYEQFVRRLRHSGRDSIGIPTLGPGTRQPFGFSLVRRGPAAVDVDFLPVPGFYPGGQPAHVRVDGEGRLLALDGSESPLKVSVERVDNVDIAAYRKQFAAREAAGGPMGQLSGRDTLRATVGTAHLAIDYGRPRRRGREIFGNVVPWNQVWRAGANAATGFTTDADLLMGGVVIPKGSYTLFVLPSPDGTKLIVNRQTGQWGTAYDPRQDLVRLDMTTERLAQTVEPFTIAIDPQGQGGALRLRWDRTQFSVPVAVK
ncbi:MAG: DUF2911 domain-containing protein [Gemmatimonadales bacterium]